MIKNLDKYEKVRDVNLTVDNLIDFVSDIVKHWENGEITAPIHLSNGKNSLIDISIKSGYSLNIIEDLTNKLLKKKIIWL